MKQEHKLYAAAIAVVALGVAYYAATREQEKDVAQHSVTAAQDLPDLTISKEDAEKVDKLIIKNKDADEVTLEKKGDKWEITAPISAEADQKAIESVIENMQKLKATALIADTPDVHEKYELRDGDGVHARAYQGDKVVLDMFFGKRGSRGQMMRRGGEGASAAVYAVDGYSSYNWAKDLKGWRLKDMITFEDTNAVAIEVENDKGKLSFTKDGEDWKGKFYPRKDDKLGAGKDIERFDGNKVKDLLRAYKNLKATDFAAADADTGIDDPIANGGEVRITLKDEDKPSKIVKVGKTQEGSNRYAAKEGGDTVYVISSWSADWAVAGVDKFQKEETKDEDAGDAADDAGDDGDHDGHDHGATGTDAKGKGASKGADTKAKDAPKGANAKAKDAPKGGDAKGKTPPKDPAPKAP